MRSEEKEKALICALHIDGISVDSVMIASLASIAQEVFFPKHTVILNIGEKQKYVYLVVSGMARSYYIDEKGNDITKMFMREKEFLMGEALFMEESLEVFETVEDVTVVVKHFCNTCG